MSIIVVCPNGHSLAVKEAFAGKRGLCPKCRAEIIIPSAEGDVLSDDDIMGILGPHDPDRSRGFVLSEPEGMRARTSVHYAAQKVIVRGSEVGAGKKCCDKCGEEIDAGTHICPHCHTYVGGRA